MGSEVLGSGIAKADAAWERVELGVESLIMGDTASADHVFGGLRADFDVWTAKQAALVAGPLAAAKVLQVADGAAALARLDELAILGGQADELARIGASGEILSATLVDDAALLAARQDLVDLLHTRSLGLDPPAAAFR